MTILARARVVLEGDTVHLTKALQGAGKAMEQAGAKFTRVGRSLSLRVTAPLAAIGAASLKMGADFQGSMNRVRGLTQATGDELAGLSAQAKDLGSTTAFSASQAADAMGFLAMAGFETNQILGAMPDVLNLAAASQLDLARSADIVSNILTGYNLSVDQLAQANDALVATTTNANVNMEMLADAFREVGPIASDVGLEFNEVAAAIGVMGDAGIQGSQAGVALRIGLGRLLNPTKEVTDALQGLGISTAQVDPRVHSLTDIIGRLERAGADASDILRIFGQRGAAIAPLISQGAGAVQGLNETLDASAGAAEELAGVQMEGLAGAMKEVRSAAEGLAIAISESGLIDWATSLAKATANLLRGLAGLNPVILRTAAAFGILAAAVGPVLIGLGTLAGMGHLIAGALAAMKVPAAIVAFTGWGKAVLALIPAVKSLSGALALLQVALGPVGWVVLGLGAAATAATVFARRAMKAGEEAKLAASRLDEMRDAARGMSQAMREAEAVRVGTQLAQEQNRLEALREEADALRESLRGAAPSEIRAAQGPLKELEGQIERQRGFVQGLRADYEVLAQAVREVPSTLGGGGDTPDLDFDFDIELPDEVAEVLAQLETDLHAAARQAELLDGAFDEGEARADAFRSAVQALSATSVGLDESIGSNGETVRDLAAAYLSAAESASKAAEAERKAREQTEAVERATKGLAERLRDNAMLQDLLAESFDVGKANADAYGQAVRALVSAGVELDAVVGPQGETLGELADTYLDLSAGVQRAAEDQAKYNRLVGEAAGVTAAFQTPLEEYEATLAHLDLLLQTVDERTGETLISQETYARAVEAATVRYREATEELGGMGQQMVHVAAVGVDAFASFATGAGNAIGSFVQRALRDIARLIARMLVARALLSAFPGVGFAVSLAGALDPTALASGGRFRSGELIMVGEEGPELMQLDQGGRVFSAPETSRMLASTASPAVARAGTEVGAARAATQASATGGSTRLDFSTFPPATNPLASARDDEWQRFLRESLEGASEDGHDPWRRGGR